ncbi:alpha/beta hydrolase [Curvibacter sp. APW13]|uniref:alpha/beta fold hydrolase n=1 Tax=Curvibacter sp. APW13 TaxID=3077236 RepID=UPI0028DD8E67|nr:alpha/beta hydrolase [Curvibacter sp. APW13]MDT8991741.1 alpha/beta hydrolase [Curvibacter sp. APW13]
MPEPKLNYVLCPDSGAGHRMAYWSWGADDAPHTVVCVHGLSRQGRDFDVLAQTLLERSKGRCRVICPDVVGRGQSDWLADAMGYQVPTYVADMAALLGQLRALSVDWVGTSMGGLIGMGVAAYGPALGVQVNRLVLNDVGPTLQWEAIQRIGQYLGRNMEFANLQQAADAMWAVSTSFGPHTPEQWLALSRPMVKSLGDGSARVRLHYDPAIAEPFRHVTQASAADGEALLWQTYDAIRASTLLLRGADSDLLSPATASAMTQRGPKARLVEFAGVGHAPTLIAPEQVEVVVRFLLQEHGFS